MLVDLFIHLCILITFIFIGGMFFKNNPYFVSVRMKACLGMMAGILGSLLMYFCIQLSGSTIMDMRQLAIIIAASYGGMISSIITAIIIAISRGIMFGITFSSIIAASATIIIGILIGLLNRLHVSTLTKWTIMIVVSSSIYSFVIYILIGSSTQFDQIMKAYWLLSIVSGFVSYYFSHYITTSNRLHYEYKQQATVDFLTGLNNRRKFQMVLSELVPEAKMKKQPLSLIIFDIDFFKKINDSYGHPAGDKVLQEIGQLLTNKMRKRDLIFRIGGEEFAIIMLDKDRHQAIQLAEDIRTAIAEHPFPLVDGILINCTVSMGISTILRFGGDHEELIMHADKALYKAKSEGRNKICWSN